MPKIFISYRRDDSGYVADSIYKSLCGAFGDDSLFFDVDGIPPGVNWKRHLRESIESCSLMVVIIGRDWLDMRETAMGERRLDQAVDFVRFEIETALRRGIPVIPLFLDGLTSIPVDHLPKSIQGLADYHGIQVRRLPDFDVDMTRLHRAIEQLLAVMNTVTPINFAVARDCAAASPFAHPSSVDIMPPPFAWIEIPDKGYSIAKYPTTNAQFAQFLEAGGYHERKWWTMEGWELREQRGWTEPRHWNDSNFNDPTQPVVGVTWYEAVAFCFWLSDLGVERIALPTEDQWQYAAQGDDNRIYPWGSNWESTRCNNQVDTVSTRTTIVTKFEHRGTSPFGVVDMVGNAWEWCLTDATTSNNNPHAVVEFRVLRGGSFRASQKTMMTTFFSHNGVPYYFHDDVGFRIARTL